MKTLIRNNYNKIQIFIPLIIIYLLITLFNSSILVDLIKFLSFQMLFLLIPGYYFSTKLISKKIDLLDKVFFGYFVSLAILFVISWISKVIHFKYLPYIMLLVTLKSLMILSTPAVIRLKSVLASNSETNRVTDDETNSICVNIIAFSLAALFVIILFILPALPPTQSFYGLFYWDDLFEVGNTWSYIRGIPMMDARVYGANFSYHFAKSIYEGVMYDLFSIDPFTSHFYLIPIFELFIFVYVIVFAGKSIVKLNIKQISFLLICCLFASGAISDFSITDTIYRSQLTYLTGYTAFIIFLFFLIEYFHSEEKLDIIYLSATSVIFFTSNVFLVMVIPVCLLIIFLLNLIKGRFSVKELLLGIGLLIVLIFSKISVYNTASSSASAMGWQGLHIQEDFSFFHLCKRIVLQFSLPENIAWAVFIFVFTVVATLISAGFIIFILMAIKKHKKGFLIPNKRGWVFLFLCFVGMTLLNALIYFKGGNYRICQISYILSSLIGAFSLKFVYIDDKSIEMESQKIEEKSERKENAIVKAVVLIFMLLFFKRVITNILPDQFHQYRNLRLQTESSHAVTLDEWKALEWMKENTHISSVFITDRTYIKQKDDILALFFAYTAIGGRQAFFESKMFETTEDKQVYKRNYDSTIAFLKEDNSKNKEKILSTIKADYFICFNKENLTKVRHNNGKGMKIVYFNNSIIIYKLK